MSLCSLWKLQNLELHLRSNINFWLANSFTYFIFLNREAADDDVVNHGVLEDVIHILGQQWRRFELKRNISTFLGKHSKERKEIQPHICYLRITNVCVSARVCVCLSLSLDLFVLTVCEWSSLKQLQEAMKIIKGDLPSLSLYGLQQLLLNGMCLCMSMSCSHKVYYLVYS